MRDEGQKMFMLEKKDWEGGSKGTQMHGDGRRLDFGWWAHNMMYR